MEIDLDEYLQVAMLSDKHGCAQALQGTSYLWSQRYVMGDSDTKSLWNMCGITHLMHHREYFASVLSKLSCALTADGLDGKPPLDALPESMMGLSARSSLEWSV